MFIFNFMLLLALGRAYWDNLANDNLKKALELQELNKNVAKNIVFFLGDGMSVTTLTAARIYKGQLDGKTGEETVLSWEEFTSTGLAKVISYARYPRARLGKRLC